MCNHLLPYGCKTFVVQPYIKPILPHTMSLNKIQVSGKTLEEYRASVHVDSPPPKTRGNGMQSRRKNNNNSKKRNRWKDNQTPEQRAIFLEEQLLKEENRNNFIRQKSEALELKRLGELR